MGCQLFIHCDGLTYFMMGYWVWKFVPIVNSGISVFVLGGDVIGESCGIQGQTWCWIKLITWDYHHHSGCWYCVVAMELLSFIWHRLVWLVLWKTLLECYYLFVVDSTTVLCLGWKCAWKCHNFSKNCVMFSFIGKTACEVCKGGWLIKIQDFTLFSSFLIRCR